MDKIDSVGKNRLKLDWKSCFLMNIKILRVQKYVIEKLYAKKLYKFYRIIKKFDISLKKS